MWDVKKIKNKISQWIKILCILCSLCERWLSVVYKHVPHAGWKAFMRSLETKQTAWSSRRDKYICRKINIHPWLNIIYIFLKTILFTWVPSIDWRTPVEWFRDLLLCDYTRVSWDIHFSLHAWFVWLLCAISNCNRKTELVKRTHRNFCLLVDLLARITGHVWTHQHNRLVHYLPCTRNMVSRALHLKKC